MRCRIAPFPALRDRTEKTFNRPHFFCAVARRVSSWQLAIAGHGNQNVPEAIFLLIVADNDFAVSTPPRNWKF